MALLSSGTVMSWGENFSGQLGNGSDCDFFYGTCPSDVPVPVSGLSGVTAIAAGGIPQPLCLNLFLIQTEPPGDGGHVSARNPVRPGPPER